MEIGEKVYVKDWRQIYSNVYRWIDGKRVTIWSWKTVIPEYSSTTFFWEKIYTPKLTIKGNPFKNGDKELVSKKPIYKNFNYEILEKVVRKDTQDIICLCKSKEGCYIQINEKGLTIFTVEEQKKLSQLETEKHLQALAKDNLGKWSIDDSLKEFPKELLKYLYDSNQNTCFGSDYPNTKAIIKYPYIHKKYTIKGNNLCLGWEQDFNGKGCDLSNKETISWNELPKKFPENSFA